jgi:hypothetical protein
MINHKTRYIKIEYRTRLLTILFHAYFAQSREAIYRDILGNCYSMCVFCNSVSEFYSPNIPYSIFMVEVL